jgi:Xaa-Pro aminopeptidase
MAQGAEGSGDLPYPRFSAGEFARRREAVRALMDSLGLDALVVFGDSSLARHGHADIHYLTGFLGNRRNYLVLTRREDPVVFVQSYNHVANAREISAAEVRWGGSDSAVAVAEHLRAAGGRAGALGYVGPVPVQSYLVWQHALPDWRARDVTESFRALRMRKSPEELDWLRRGAALTDAAFRALVEGTRPGLREYELAALVEADARRRGGLPHLAYMASTPQDDPAVCVPRQTLSGRTIQPGDVVITEISVSYGGYSGQLHRPLFVQRDPTPVFRRLWDVALLAYRRCVDALRPGATTEDVLDAADVIHDEGFTIHDDLLHGFGIGLLPPTLRTRRTAHGHHAPLVFEPGMCVVVQPNVVTPDERAGVQLGNLLAITDSGTECLHRVPLQYFVVG